MSRTEIAVIDAGTNMFHLLIGAKDENGRIFLLDKYNDFVFLGGSTGSNIRMIDETAWKRAMQTIEKYRRVIDEKKIKKVIAYGTSAFRSAENRKKFIDEIKTRFNIEMKVISGKEEATFIYEGVRNGMKLDEGKTFLIMDIGGGSVEFIVCDSHEAQLMHSINIGASRLLHEFIHSDPVSDDDEKNCITYLKTELAELFSELRRISFSALIGCAGSFETFARILFYQKNNSFPENDLHEFSFTRDEFFSLHHEFLRCSREERLKIKGMESKRVDMIVPASILTKLILETLKLKKIIHSASSLKEGALFHALREGNY